MKITLNNRPETIENADHLTVGRLLELKRFTYKMLLVKVNEETITQEQFSVKEIKDGDKVAVIHLMSGG